MIKTEYIKPIYKSKDVQDDLTLDSLHIMSMNITHNFKRYNNRFMNEKEIDKLVKMLYSSLRIQNEIDVEYNQTS
jgi:hypothetical protein